MIVMTKRPSDDSSFIQNFSLQTFSGDGNTYYSLICKLVLTFQKEFLAL